MPVNDNDAGRDAPPQWRGAADKFRREKIAPGTILKFEWLYDGFGMADPKTADSIPEFLIARLDFLQLFGAFRDWVLEDQKYALRNHPGLGYEVLRPNEQAGWTMVELEEKLKHEFRKATRRLTHVREGGLDAAARRELTDARARVGALENCMRPKRRSSAA